jgi:hypothetical protein
MKVIVGGLIALLILVGGFFVLNNYIYQREQGTQATIPKEPPILPTSSNQTPVREKATTTAPITSTAPISGKITYFVLNWAEPSAHRFELYIQYSANCDFYYGLTIDTGDGQIHEADCGSGFNHKYPHAGQYTVRYFYGTEEIARTIVDVK